MEQVWKRRWHGFWQLADPKIWVASTVPMLVATALAYAHTGNVDLPWFFIALAGIYLIEIGKNAVNEFVDYWTGVDRYVTADKRNPFSGGKKTIVDGKLTMGETMVIAFLTLLVAFCVGVAISVFKEPGVFWVGMAGGVLAVFYSFPPFKLNYRGYGEAAVGLAFGPLLLSGMYLMLTGSVSWPVVLAGVPLAFMITNVLWINQYPDYEADLKGGKRNWLVRIGKKAGIRVYAILYAGAYVSLAALAYIDRNPYWLLGYAALPLSIRTVRTAAANLDRLDRFLSANAGTVQGYQLMGLAMLAAALLAP